MSLLVDYEPASHPHDWTIGVHGIIISFTGPDKREYSATYLPEVAKEQGWDHEETVESLVRKAGFVLALTPELLSRMQCTRYKSSKSSATYAQWLASRSSRYA